MIKKFVLTLVLCVMCWPVFGAATEGIFWISGSNVVMTGSIDVTGANTDVPGSGTAFTTELGIGSSILVSGETRVIATITDDDTATVTSAWGSDLANDTSPEIVPYATLNAFEADLIDLTGNLTIYHRDEETALASTVTFDLDTNGFLLKITAEPGAEHDASAYGNGARINFATSTSIAFDEVSGSAPLDDIEFSNMALDISGSSNVGLSLFDGANSGTWLVDRLLIKGDAASFSGISTKDVNATIRNSYIYDVGDGSTDSAIRLNTTGGTGRTINIYNNTIPKCNIGVFQDVATTNMTYVIKNNLVQGSINNDFQDDGAGFGTTAFNISEDATSPDASYRSKDLHTNSVFLGYATDDYRLDPDGDSTNLAIVDDGENLFGSGVTEDGAGNARDNGTPFWIGASHIAADGVVFIPSLNWF